MKIKIELLEDAIFASGMSVPGGEDNGIQIDENGFPIFKGTTFKGNFKEQFIRLLYWKGFSQDEFEKMISVSFGKEGQSWTDTEYSEKIYFSNFTLSEGVKQVLKSELNDVQILNSLTNLRTFTAIEDDSVKEGSLREYRCLNKGLIFYGEIISKDKEELILETLQGIKWLGMLKKRGFGKVLVSAVGEEK